MKTNVAAKQKILSIIKHPFRMKSNRNYKTMEYGFPKEDEGQ